MAIDSSIALQGKLPQFDNPLTQFAQVAAIQNAQQQNRLADLTYSEKEREVGENKLLGEQYKAALGADGTMDRNKLYTGLAGAGLGAKLPGIQKGFADQDKAALDATKAKLEAGLKHFEVVGQIMSGVKDQASYDIARQQAAQLFGPDAAAKLPAGYDPAVIEQNRQQAMGVKDQLEQQWKALHFGMDQQKFAYQQGNDAANRGVTVRGQDISQGTAIRGQDITVRGQDLTDKRALETIDAKAEAASLKSAATAKPTADYLKQADAYQNMDDALTGYKTVLKGFGTMDSLSPTKRAELGTAYQNTLLQAKEIYKLGVLNGGDERILKSIINNPLDWQSTIIPKPALLKQADDLGAIIKRANENLSKVNKQEIIPLNSQGAPVQQVAEAVKNGEVAKLVNARPAKVNSAADYAKLPSGTVYTAPDGSMRTKS